jgi:signal transduction histidine kinase
MKSRSMTILDVTILTAALVNLVFSATVYLHSRRKVVETIFAAFAFSVSLWSFATFLMTSEAVSFEAFKAGAHLHYISGNLVFWSLLWFSAAYGTRKDISLFLPVVLSVINAVILILILSTPFLFISIQDAPLLADKIIFSIGGYLILSIATIGMFILSQTFLARKYFAAAGEEKTQIGGIILGTSIAGSLGLITNLIFPGFGNFSVLYLGPIITTPLFVGIMVYAILKYKLFNIRVITAEIFTALLMISLAAELFLSNTSAEYGSRILVMLVAAVLGYFLIRSVYREIIARQEIERLNRTMQEFVAITSHQIRSPLTHIKTALSVVRDGDYGPIDPRAMPVLGRVLLSTERLITLVNDLLDMSRMQSGKMQYAVAGFDFVNLVDSVVTELIDPAKDKGVALVWQKQKQPIIVKGDQQKLRQVVFNLVDNALKYTEKGSIEIKVNRAVGGVEFTVKDSGAGMSKETIERLFQKFARGESGPAAKTEGTGLGLYVARRIVDDHKGELWAESDGPGKGSTFYLRLSFKGSRGLGRKAAKESAFPKAA